MYSVQYVHPTIEEKNASPKLKVNTVFMFSKCNCNIILWKMRVDSALFRKLAHFYNKRFTDFLPEFTQISKQTFARINDIITTIYIRNRNNSFYFHFLITWMTFYKS